MTIQFVCSCGKHLGAGEHMARCQAMCPAGFSPARGPPLQPTHARTPAGPLSPAEIERARRKLPPGAAVLGDTPADEPMYRVLDPPDIAPVRRPLVLDPTVIRPFRP